jgi:alpha-D-ribose 1-methylphosphonate 5-triphosphate synthase subunit PhnG
LNFTAVAPVKLVPTIATEVPTGPEEGVKLVIVGTTGCPANAGEAGMTREASVRTTDSTKRRGEDHARPRPSRVLSAGVNQTSNLYALNRGQIVRQIVRIGLLSEDKCYCVFGAFKPN